MRSRSIKENVKVNQKRISVSLDQAAASVIDQAVAVACRAICCVSSHVHFLNANYPSDTRQHLCFRADRRIRSLRKHDAEEPNAMSTTRNKSLLLPENNEP